MQKFTAWLLGRRPEFIDPCIVAQVWQIIIMTVLEFSHIWYCLDFRILRFVLSWSLSFHRPSLCLFFYNIIQMVSILGRRSWGDARAESRIRPSKTECVNEGYEAPRIRRSSVGRRCHHALQKRPCSWEFRLTDVERDAMNGFWNHSLFTKKKLSSDFRN